MRVFKILSLHRWPSHKIKPQIAQCHAHFVGYPLSPIDLQSDKRSLPGPPDMERLKTRARNLHHGNEEVKFEFATGRVFEFHCSRFDVEFIENLRVYD